MSTRAASALASTFGDPLIKVTEVDLMAAGDSQALVIVEVPLKYSKHPSIGSPSYRLLLHLLLY